MTGLKNFLSRFLHRTRRETRPSGGEYRPPARLSPATYNHLMEQYQPDIQRLEEMLSRSLDVWPETQAEAHLQKP